MGAGCGFGAGWGAGATGIGTSFGTITGVTTTEPDASFGTTAGTTTEGAGSGSLPPAAWAGGANTGVRAEIRAMVRCRFIFVFLTRAFYNSGRIWSTYF
jgi:hypothetical protein